MEPERNRWAQIPIFLKATAGMRVITDLPARDAIMNDVRAFLGNKTNCPFYFEPMMARSVCRGAVGGDGSAQSEIGGWLG